MRCVRCRSLSRPSSHEASCPRCIDFIAGCAVRRATLCCTGAPRCVACAIQQGFLHCANMARVQQATAKPARADSNDSRRRRRLSTARLAASSCRRMSWRCSRSSRTCGRATPSCVYAAWACYVVHAMWDPVRALLYVACYTAHVAMPRGVNTANVAMPRGINTANVYTCHDVACMPRRRWHAVYSMSRGMPCAVCHVACCILHQRHLMPRATCHAACHVSQADRISLLHCRLVIPVMPIMHSGCRPCRRVRARRRASSVAQARSMRG